MSEIEPHLQVLLDSWKERATLRQGGQIKRERLDDVAALEESAEALITGNRLFNQPPPPSIARENYRHRTMVYLAAQGYNAKEIAEITDYSECQVTIIMRQSWFVTKILEIQEKMGAPGVERLLGREIVPSIVVLKEIRDNEKEKGSTRVSAVNALLNRALGMPTQHIKSESRVTIGQAEKEVLAVDKELAQVEKQLKDAGVTTGTPSS